MNLTEIKDQAKSDSKSGMNFASVSPMDVLRLVAIADAAMKKPWMKDDDTCCQCGYSPLDDGSPEHANGCRFEKIEKALAGVTR